jgi:hypothetical protein
LYLLNKLLNNYKHDNVKIIINNYIQNYLLVEWEKFIHDLTIFYNKIKDLKTKGYKNLITQPNLPNNQTIISEFDNQLYFFYRRIFSYVARIVDLYFIRRFLDKDYITNTIVYAGAAHSVSFIFILNSIGFKITHCANCSIKNMNKLNKAVSEIKNFPFEECLFDLLDLFIQPNAKQCIDISNFPKNFE